MSKVKGGLGKGLSALIRLPAKADEPLRPSDQPASAPVATPAKPPAVGSITHIEIAKIRPNPFQPRADFDQQALDELKHSIKQKGIIQPITVRHADNGMYELISGERRIRASTELGMKTIPAYVIEVRTQVEMLELALIENLQREHLNPIEIAISYQRLMNDVELSVEDVARKVSKDRTTVVNFLRLLKLPEKIQHALRKGGLTAGHARALLALPDELTQLKFFEKITKSDLNVRQVERLVREFSQKKEKKVFHITPAAQTSVGSIEEKIRYALGTKVKVNVHEGGKGEIVIEFYSNDDLVRLFDLITSIQQ